MTRPLRRLHAGAAMALALALPATLAVAVAYRRGDRAAAPLPETRPVPEGRIVHEADDRWTGLDAATRLRVAPDGRAFLEVVPASPLAHPDLLLYWTPEAPTGGLAANAVLLGSFDGDRPNAFLVPPAARTDGGFLALYSLGHRAVVATAELASDGTGKGGARR
jgi:hypothetical protein